MKHLLPLFLVIFSAQLLSAQVLIKGYVADEKGESLVGANVYLDNTYDGGTSKPDGTFAFETEEVGKQVLVVSFIGYETQKVGITISDSVYVNITLKEAFNTVDAVTITAGSLEASDEKEGVVLKSLDIAMTAGASADIVGALTTLPGMQKVGESGRLFVRGGESREVKAFVDGVEVSNFYSTTVTGLPSRSRFSPFLFKGTFFSTGGYSAEYGQALSSVLSLNSTDPDPVPSVELSLLSVGASVAVNQAFEDESVYAELSYNNLNPYTKLVPQRVNWINASESLNGTLSYKKKLENGGKIRMMAMGSTNGFELEQPTLLNEQGFDHIKVTNKNAFFNSVWETPIRSKGVLYVGGSIGLNEDDKYFNENNEWTSSFNSHVKLKYSHEFTPQTLLNAGTELYFQDYESRLVSDDERELLGNFQNTISTAFVELSQYFSEKWVVKAGGRFEYGSYLDGTTFSPRLSLAHKLSATDQISLATGVFLQNPATNFLRFSHKLEQERASHILLNYQRVVHNQIFRLEGYYKKYDDLLTFADEYDAETYGNEGDGYAYGAELFWRNRNEAKSLDYWVSYSWMKSERLYRDFPVKAMPTFTSEHNFSLVVKKFLPTLKSQIGFTYSFTSGRPYNDLNKDGFNEGKTKAYHDLSFNMAYLPKQNVIIYLSASNILSADQVFGYQFSEQPDDTGYYPSEPMKLSAKQFFVLGCFVTIGRSANQKLEEL
ncbi:TonB-dependent receptor [Flammeovirgaceae bacterium SG7u.111]|nr:TonB-dependent receptor [Flammeovirgaceae bacterium SG7u.132]WPO34591.1 TonB-dependent receptor [Flammeovirgaceae bacterium SG7u.111]